MRIITIHWMIKSAKKEIAVKDTLVDGAHIPKSYKTRFTLDMVSGNLQISNVFGATGMTYFAFSDILGNHQNTIWYRDGTHS